MNDFLYEVSYKTMGMLLALLICAGFLTHPFITGAVLTASIVVGRVLWVRSERREAQAAKDAQDQRVAECARDAADRMQQHPIRIRHRFTGYQLSWQTGDQINADWARACNEVQRQQKRDKTP